MSGKRQHFEEIEQAFCKHILTFKKDFYVIVKVHQKP